MDKQLARKLSDDIKLALDSVAKKHGLTVSLNGGSFDDTQFKPKIIFRTPIDKLEKKNASDEDIHNGFARPGTEILTSSGKKATIVSVRRTKYLIDIDGQQYTINFRGCRSLKDFTNNLGK